MHQLARARVAIATRLEPLLTELANGVATAEPDVAASHLAALAGVVRRVPKPLSPELLAKVEQAALAQAATARAQAASSSCCVPAAPTPKPASTAGEPAGEMPERMRLAAARRAAADAAVAGTSVAGTSGKAKASGMTSNDKNSVTQRLARLQASAIRTAAPDRHPNPDPDPDPEPDPDPDPNPLTLTR